jgi:outer membrane lipoprotein-sorting protein/peroxiredoxin
MNPRLSIAFSPSRRRARIASAIALVAFASARSASAQAPALPPSAAPFASSAKELLDAVGAGMAEASAVAFEAKFTTRIGQIEIAQKEKVLLERPDHARLELAGAGQDQLLVYDGTTAWHYLKYRRAYLESKQLGTAKLEQYGVGPAASLFFSKGAGALAPYVADAAVSTEKLGDDECRVVAWSVGPEESRVWIRGSRLRRFRTVHSVGTQSVEQTVDYGEFDLAPKVAADSFTFVPPERASPLEPDSDEGLLEVGAAAPDFAVTTLDGKTMRRRDFGEGALLVTFWFYGCATCREELPRVEKLHVEFAPRGVRMVAVNFRDPRETVATYFAREKFTLAPVLQEKDAVSEAFGVQVYPTTYLLDREGRVAWRAVGFDEASLRAALEKVAAAK